MPRKRPRSFVVIGLGAFGGTVATTLASLGDEVLGIDIDEKRVRDIAEKLTHAVIADARDDDALKEAGVAERDVAIVSIGEDLEASILCTMNLKLIGIPTIWVKALSRTHHRILTRLGADRVIRPERDMGLHVAETLHTPFVADYLSLGNGFLVVNLIVPDGAKTTTIGELLELAGGGVKVLGVMRASDLHPASHVDMILQDGDRVMVLGRRAQLRELAGSLWQ